MGELGHWSRRACGNDAAHKLPSSRTNRTGVEWREYGYFNPATIGLDFEKMIADIQAAPEGSVIVLHGEGLGWLGGIDCRRRVLALVGVRWVGAGLGSARQADSPPTDPTRRLRAQPDRHRPHQGAVGSNRRRDRGEEPLCLL